MKEKLMISENKFQELLTRKNYFEQTILPKIREEKRHAIDTGGGTHDNASYESLLIQEEVTMRQVTDLQQTLGNCVIIDNNSMNLDEARIGTTVQLQDLNSDKPITYSLVGAFDTNIKENKIAYDTPLGKEILGMKVGEARSFKLPNGVTKHLRLDKIEKSEK